MNRDFDYYPPDDERELNPLRAGGRMLLFKGGSKSKSTSTSATNNIDKRLVVDSGIGVTLDNGSSSVIDASTHSNTDIVVNQTDLGAIQAGMSLADKSISGAVDMSRISQEGAQKSLSTALGFADDALGGVLSFVKDANANADARATNALDKVIAAYDNAQSSQDGTQALVKTGLVIVGIVGVGLVMGRR